MLPFLPKPSWHLIQRFLRKYQLCLAFGPSVARGGKKGIKSNQSNLHQILVGSTAKFEDLYGEGFRSGSVLVMLLRRLWIFETTPLLI